MSFLPPAYELCQLLYVVPVDTGWDGVWLSIMGVVVSFIGGMGDLFSDGTGVDALDVDGAPLLGPRRGGALLAESIFGVSAALLPPPPFRGRPTFLISDDDALDDELEAAAAADTDDIVPPLSPESSSFFSQDEDVSVVPSSIEGANDLPPHRPHELLSMCAPFESLWPNLPLGSRPWGGTGGTKLSMVVICLSQKIEP